MVLADGSIFLNINLPNPTTWFYFSGLLAVALFFKFSRLLSMRNLDVLTLYLFMPGLLLLAEGNGHTFWGYLWLMIASLYFLFRCLLDLALVRRPALSSNLDLAGLIWLAGICSSASSPSPSASRDQPRPRMTSAELGSGIFRGSRKKSSGLMPRPTYRIRT